MWKRGNKLIFFCRGTQIMWNVCGVDRMNYLNLIDHVMCINLGSRRYNGHIITFRHAPRVIILIGTPHRFGRGAIDACIIYFWIVRTNTVRVYCFTCKNPYSFRIKNVVIYWVSENRKTELSSTLSALRLAFVHRLPADHKNPSNDGYVAESAVFKHDWSQNKIPLI